MLMVSQRLLEKRTPDVQLVLPFDERRKSRLRTTLPGGEEVGLMLERGSMLRGGDQLIGDDGRVIEIVAADEKVSTVRASDPEQLARISYHLGNRHVSLQIGAGWVRYQHDHVLDDMVRGLGSSVDLEYAPFEPEAGAYGAHTHAHDEAHAIIRGTAR